MSEYKDFSRCVICRSEKNLNSYNGEFEVTMLLNTLYMAVMMPFEKRREMHLKSKKIVEWLKNQKIFDNHGNSFNADDFLRYLRNGLAHINVMTTRDAGEISLIKIVAKNQTARPLCRESCSKMKCLPMQYIESDGSICTFTFSVAQLREFTEFVIKSVLDAIPNDICGGCSYNGGMKCQD